MFRKHWHVRQIKVGGIYLENVKFPRVKGQSFYQTLEHWVNKNFPEERLSPIDYYHASLRGWF